MKSILIVVFTLLLVQFNAHAQHQLSGQILDEKNQILNGANIWLSNSNRISVSNAEGKFSFKNLKNGQYKLNVSFVGYEKFQTILDLNASKDIKINLEALTILTDEVIVNATRANEKMPITYTTIHKQEIEKENLGQDIPYLLNQTPSVVVTSDAGNGMGYTGIRIRGSDATRINVTINGIPYNDAESQGTFWVDLPDVASSIENIQVQRGVGTSTNGAGAFGATINVQTSAYKPQAYGQIDNSFGSFNSRKHTVMAGTGLINDRFTIDARLSKLASDGYIDRATSDLGSYFISGGYYGKSTLLKLNVFSGKERTYQSWYGTPASRLFGTEEDMLSYAGRNGLTTGQTDNLLYSGRTYNFYEYENEVDDYKQDHYQVILAQDISEKFNLNTALFYTHGQGYFEQFKEDDSFSDYGLPDVTIGNEVITNTDLIRRRWLSNDFYGITYALEGKVSKKLTTTIGGAFNQYRGNHYGKIIWAQIGSINKLGDRYYDSDSKKNDFNIYLKAQQAINDKLNAFLDVQFRAISYQTMGIDSDRRPIDVNESFNFFNPKVGLTYDIRYNIQSYISYSRGNREPVRSDFIDVNEGQKPSAESLDNIEMGIRSAGKKYQFNANLYLMNYKNQLVLTGELNDVGASVRTNVDKSYRAGIELQATFIPNEKWNISANMTFSQNKIKEFTEIVYDYGVNWDQFNIIENNYSNTDISFSPNLIAGSTITYNPLNNFSIALLSKIVGRQYLDNSSNSNRQIDSYIVNDIRFIWQLKPKFLRGLDFNFRINNLFNEVYSSNGYTWGYQGGGEHIQENFFYPQAGTNFMAGLSIKF